MYDEPYRRRNGDEEESYEEGDERGGRGARRNRICQFCSEKIETIDYKQADLLRKFVTERGQIRPRHQTGTCARHQRGLGVAVKRARHMALLVYVAERAR